MGRGILEVCSVLGREVVGFLDERPSMKEQIIDHISVIGDITDLCAATQKDDIEVVCAGVGDPALKYKFVQKTIAHGFRLAGPLIHPSAIIARSAKVGVGSIVCAGVILNVHTVVGDFVIVNTNVTLGHDVRVKDYTTISPGVNIGGNVMIEYGVYIGTDSAVVENKTIGAWSMIGGGALVKDHVPDHVLYAGVPAVFKKIRTGHMPF